MAAISLRNIVKKYGDGFPAVNDVSIEIADGEFVILVGPSGCGKSTLLRMIVGLEDITSGDLHIGERRVNDLAPRERNLAMVFQNYALYPHMSVAENMGFALKMAKMPVDERNQRVQEAAKMLGLTEYLDRKPKALSGGQRQRISIARALASNPQFIVCDEPTSALDVSVQAQVLNLLKQLQRDLQLTYLFISHDMAVVRVMAHRIGVLKDGRLVEENEAGKLIESPQQPYTRMLMESTPRFAGGVG